MFYAGRKCKREVQREERESGEKTSLPILHHETVNYGHLTTRYLIT